MTDWKEVWKEAISAARGKLEARAPEAQSQLGDIAEAHKKSLRALLSAFSDGKIDEQTLESELADERLVFERELLALPIVTKRAGRDATTAFFDAIEEAAAKS